MRKKRNRKMVEVLVVNESCCGIDIGSKSFVVATGLTAEDVKEYGVFTEDIDTLIKDLKSKQVKNIAMESTGSYWQPLFSALQLSGFDVRLVDGKQTKNYKKKTDFQDARSIYQLHRLGFLKSCFLPDEFTESLRSLVRHRAQILKENARCVNRMQKLLRLMNFRIDNIISDVVGRSGRRLIEAIIDGKTDKEYLVSLVDHRVRKSKEELLKGLLGQIDVTKVFILSDCYNAFINNEKRVKSIDHQIKILLEEVVKDTPLRKGTTKVVNKNQINIGLQNLSYRYYGVDLFAIDNVSYNLVLSFISEVGLGVNKFDSHKEFCSWLRLAPNNKISGGKILSSRTPKGKSPLAVALRNAANTISRKKEGYLPAFFKRIAYKKGRAAAITATARKLATIMFNMVKNQEEYFPMSEKQVSDQIKQKVINNFMRKMKQFQIDPRTLDLQFS
ncbi:MAG: IS110 family transposase [Saprospiraceae bacterium]|nr:IS110 family transposase [Saprospiraceae bacterium]